MSNSIYDISAWQSGGVFYQKNSIVLYNGYYYYALKDNTSGVSGLTNPIVKTQEWGGVGASPYDGTKKQEFIWKPSYQSKISHQPKTRIIQFDDGYEQSIKKNLYNDLIEISLSFNNRNSFEAAAITHFFYNLGGATSFVWVPMPPHASPRLFKCKDWSDSHDFHDNISIDAQFVETNI